jgi:A/G-specific adenine glycosylase
MMEFGAIQCTPVAPNCLFCPFQQNCRAFLTGRQHLLPVKSKKQPVRERYFNYIVIQQVDAAGELRIAMRQRLEKDVWQNLYDFALIETDEPVDAFRYLSDNETSQEVLRHGFFSGIAEEKTQLLSHQRIRAKFWRVTLRPDSEMQLKDGLKFYELAEIEQLPKPILIADYLK